MVNFRSTKRIIVYKIEQNDTAEIKNQNRRINFQSCFQRNVANRRQQKPSCLNCLEMNIKLNKLKRKVFF